VRTLLILALAAGCTFSTRLDHDGSTDPKGSEPTAMSCYGTGLGVSVCLAQKPSGALDGAIGDPGVSAVNEGGGGGGGGAGVIKLFRATAPGLGLVSPPFS
jgi:hypothetical protein